MNDTHQMGSRNSGVTDKSLPIKVTIVNDLFGDRLVNYSGFIKEKVLDTFRCFLLLNTFVVFPFLKTPH